MEVELAALVSPRARPRALLLVATLAILAVLVLAVAACGQPDFTGTFGNQHSGIVVSIHKADDDGWLVRFGPGTSSLVPDDTAVERDGRLYLGRGDILEFVPEGDDLRLNFVGGADEGAPSQLLRRVTL